MLVKINWKPNRVELRKFGMVMLIAGALIGGILFWKGKISVAIWVISAGAFIAASTVVAPAAAMLIYLAWMSVALVMGTIVSSILMFVIFFGVITPAGLLMRMFGRDGLKLRRGEQSSHWVKIEPSSDKKTYERLF